MAIEIDGRSVLKAIAGEDDLFSEMRGELNQAARTLVIKRIKLKTTTAAILRTLCKAIGEKPLALIVDGLSDADVKSVLLRVDKHSDAAKAADPRARRQHLMALAAGDATPAATPQSTADAPKAAAPERLQSAAVAALRKRKKT